MSDPFDARVLRRMVRDLASEEMPAIDWDRAEERLFARLEGEGYLASDDVVGSARRPPLPASRAEGNDDDQSRVSSESDELSVDEDFGERISEVALGDLNLDDLNTADLNPDDLNPRVVTGSPTDRAVGDGRVPATDVGHDGDRQSVPYVAAVGAEGRVSRPPQLVSTHDGLRQSSFGRTHLSEADARATERRRRWSVAAIVAVAACFAFVVGGVVAKHTPAPPSAAVASGQGEHPEITAERWIDPADVPMAPGASAAHDLGALRAGDVVEASAGAVSFEGASSASGSDPTEKVSWTLAPGSRVLVRSGFGGTSPSDGVDASRHVLILESGSIRAEISGIAGASIVDPFVIEAGDTAVAVGDTIFSVTRSSKGIVVDVEKGHVAVGPRRSSSVVASSDGVEPAMKILDAPSRGSFSLDGGRSFKALEPVTVSYGAVSYGAALDGADRGASPLLPLPISKVARNDARHEPAEVGTAGPGPLSMVPGDPVLTEASIRSALDRCFAQVEAQRKSSKDKSDNVSVVMRSLLRLRVADDGAIKGAAFNPPLRSDLQSCAVSLLSAHVDRGARTLEIPVEIRP